ncbi:ATP-binding protein [Phocaeicola sp.]|uniref:sensor histidine kinase n=1 Tax=Phocaeicola sp. TaxID=2773926 RepID=UPI0023BC2F91|nr:ATP-binding protein [Phocaeicola sp.]MDE5676581.1 GHKL domain-containing protein [Phocaeicola sp.]
MVFSKHLYIVILGYLISILIVAGTGLALVVTHTAIILGCILVVISLFFIGALVKRLNRFNSKIRTFLDAIEDKENMIFFNEQSADKEMNALSRSLNRINNLLATTQSHNLMQKNFYYSLLEEIPDGILAWNAEQKILFTNGAALRLLGMEQIRFLYQLEEQYPSLKDFIAYKNMQKSYLLQSDSQKQLSLSINQMKLNSEQISMLAIKDISHELSNKESESWNKLTRVLTHEIMNTIAPIVSLSQTLSSHREADEKVIRGLRVIREQSERLMEFTESYRRLSCMPEPKKKRFSLTNSLRNLSLLLQSDFENAHIHFILNSTPMDISFDGDEKQLSQVFLNLLKNSIQSLEGETEGQIILTLKATDKLYIKILDNGRGIPMELQEKIFVPFFTTKKEGTGIGLSLCRQIIKRHGGNLFLQESKQGKTLFVITLPFVKEPAPCLL